MSFHAYLQQKIANRPASDTRENLDPLIYYAYIIHISHLRKYKTSATENSINIRQFNGQIRIILLLNETENVESKICDFIIFHCNLHYMH